MRAAIYSRISSDDTLEGKGVDRQRQDCEALCEREGYEVIGTFEDNDVSAAGKVKKARPQYTAMLDSAKAGEFEVIVAYSNSRLTRRPRELEDLLDLNSDHGTLIKTVVSGADDLSTADGRQNARLRVVIDAGEAERTAERLKRQKQQRASEGKAQGGRYRVFGYTRDWKVIASEAALVVEAFQRRAQGESTKAIANDFASRGVIGASGKPMKSSTLDHIFRKPGYAGLREYKGQIIGKTDYPPIIDEATYEAAQANLVKDSVGVNPRKHLLSGILVCSKCLSTMTGKNAPKNKSNPRKAYYKCSNAYGSCGNISIQMDSVDLAVWNAAYRKWQDDFFADKTQSRTPARNYQAETEEIDERIREVQEAHTSGAMPLVDAMPLLKGLREARAAVVKEKSEEVVADLGILQPMSDWETDNLSQRRLFIGRYVSNVVVAPWNKGKPNEWRERLTIHFKDGTIGGVSVGKIVDRLNL